MTAHTLCLELNQVRNSLTANLTESGRCDWWLPKKKNLFNNIIGLEREGWKDDKKMKCPESTGLELLGISV